MPSRLLVVDDEPAVREALQRSLAFEGYGTEVAVDGVDALTRSEAYAPDLIVLDIQMPRMDGLTAARRLRAAGSLTPILMLTARDTVGDRVTGLDAGADDYLVKPFELDELFARIRALLRRSSYATRRARRPTTTCWPSPICGWTWRPARSTAAAPGGADPHRIHAARTVSAEPRQVLPASRSSSLSGASTSSPTRTRSRCICYLRRKTEAGGEPRLVHTVRGVGYALREST